VKGRTFNADEDRPNADHVAAPTIRSMDELVGASTREPTSTWCCSRCSVGRLLAAIGIYGLMSDSRSCSLAFCSA